MESIEIYFNSSYMYCTSHGRNIYLEDEMSFFIQIGDILKDSAVLYYVPVFLAAS